MDIFEITDDSVNKAWAGSDGYCFSMKDYTLKNVSELWDNDIPDNVSKSQIIRLLFPVSFNIYWFIQCYLLMYIIHPLLNKIIDNINQKSHLQYSIIFIILNVIIVPLYKLFKILVKWINPLFNQALKLNI